MTILKHKTNGYTITISLINDYRIYIEITDTIGLSIIEFPISIEEIRKIFDLIENKIEEAESFCYSYPSLQFFDIALLMKYIDSELINFSIGETHQNSYTITRFSITTNETKLKDFFAEFEQAIEYSKLNMLTLPLYSGALCS